MDSTLSLPAAVEDVILRDGRTLRLRPPVEADVDAVVAFLESLSAESRHYRFHGARVGAWHARHSCAKSINRPGLPALQ